MKATRQHRRATDRAFGLGLLIGLTGGYVITLAIFVWIIGNSG